VALAREDMIERGRAGTVHERHRGFGIGRGGASEQRLHGHSGIGRRPIYRL
jgi:hypothetical protein